jgi:hypothetical protein
MPEKLILTMKMMPHSCFSVPADAKPGDDIHIVLSATDTGTPALTRYVRVVLRVK